MRLNAARLLTLLIPAIGTAAPALAQQPPGEQHSAQHQPAPGQPPHAWLFGTWTGGMYPAPTSLTAEACLAQPVVIFTRDVVLRATLTETIYNQRVIETALTSSSGTEFRFAAASPSASSDLLGMPEAANASGFGCDTPDVLHVQRRTNNEITFPGCTDFPYPLVRCPAG